MTKRKKHVFFFVFFLKVQKNHNLGVFDRAGSIWKNKFLVGYNNKKYCFFCFFYFFFEKKNFKNIKVSRKHLKIFFLKKKFSMKKTQKNEKCFVANPD